MEICYGTGESACSTTCAVTGQFQTELMIQPTHSPSQISLKGNDYKLYVYEYIYV